MNRLSFGDYILDRHKSRLYYRDEPLDLEPQIYGILELLISRHGDIITRDDMINAVWDGRLVSNNVIDNRIKSVRAAIDDNGKAQRLIKTYPNRGYKFIGEVSVVPETTQAAEIISSAPQPEPEINSEEKHSKNGSSWLQKIPVLMVAALAFVGAFGFFVHTQSSRSGISQAPSVSELSDKETVYRLAISDDPNALPRVAVLPVEAIGEKSDYGFLPEVLKGEMNNTITAIDGITVVAISSGAEFADDIKDYQVLRDTFNLDYAITSTMIPYGKNYELNVSLVRTEDGTVLFNESFDLDVSSENGLADLPVLIARKVTLMSANKLSLSVDRLPQSWQNYDFYKKYEEAKLIGARRDYESTKRSLELLREVMTEEPNFIPAYATFLKYLSWQVLFYQEDRGALFREQADVSRKINEIAPEAPETLITNAFMREPRTSYFTPTLGPYDPRNRISVAEHILKSDPDNLEAHLILSRYTDVYRSRAETVEAVENALRLVPTDPKVLSEYYSALFCNQQIDQARAVLDRATQWHANHRDVLLAEIKHSRSVGEYETALVKTRQLLKQGYVTTNEVFRFSLLFFDLGHPELTLPHARNSLNKAEIYARLGDKEATIREASVVEHAAPSYNARMMVDDDYVPKSYREIIKIKRVDAKGEPIPRLCSLRNDMRKIYNFKHIDPANYEKIGSINYETNLSVLTDYYKGKGVTDLRVQEEFTSLMGLHLLEGHPDKAIEVMDAAMERGFLFLGTLKEPYLRELKSHPGFAERLERMQKSADLLIEKYYLF